MARLNTSHGEGRRALIQPENRRRGQRDEAGLWMQAAGNDGLTPSLLGPYSNRPPGRHKHYSDWLDSAEFLFLNFWFGGVRI